MERDKIINYNSKVATSNTITNAIVNNSDSDKNLQPGEIAVVMTDGNEGLYTLNHDGTVLIEYKPANVFYDKKDIDDKLSKLTIKIAPYQAGQNANDMLSYNENGLSLSNVWDCGEY